MKTLACALAGVALLALATAAGESFARKGSGSRAGAHSGGARSGSAHHHRHRHRHARSAVFSGALFASPALYAYHYPPPYYYGPDFTQPHYDPPTVYVEQFPGTPTAQTQGEIFCPAKEAHYPDVDDCPGGWQRVIRVPQGG
jgi:hypothetical protein